MKKVALVMRDLAHGGAERAMSRLSYILDEDYEVYMVLFNANKIDYPFAGKLIDMNISIEQNIFRKILMIFNRIQKLKSIKKELDIDITISFLDGPNLINIISRVKDKVIVSIRNYKGKEVTLNWLYKIQGKLIPVFYNKSDNVVCVSELIKIDLQENFGVRSDKLNVIYNPYDINQIIDLSNEGLSSQEDFFYKEHKVIATVGRLMYQKGFWNLIKVINLIKREIPSVGLVIVGDGPMETNLKEFVRDCGLENNILFVGYQKNPYKYVSRANVYTTTSLFEGFPNALVEAMCCGVPVVSTDCKSGPREILVKKNNIMLEAKQIEYTDFGVLVPPFRDGENWDIDDIDESHQLMSEALIEILKNQDLQKYYSEQAKIRARDFSYERCKHLYQNLIEK